MGKPRTVKTDTGTLPASKCQFKDHDSRRSRRSHVAILGGQSPLAKGERDQKLGVSSVSLRLTRFLSGIILPVSWLDI